MDWKQKCNSTYWIFQWSANICTIIPLLAKRKPNNILISHKNNGSIIFVVSWIVKQIPADVSMSAQHRLRYKPQHQVLSICHDVFLLTLWLEWYHYYAHLVCTEHPQECIAQLHNAKDSRNAIQRFDFFKSNKTPFTHIK